VALPPPVAPTDFVGCVFEGGETRIEETLGGKTRKLASRKGPSYLGRAFDVVVGVHGGHVSFTVDGISLLEADTARDAGTAGLGVWDPSWGHAAVEAEYVRVEPYGASATAATPLPKGEPVREDIDRGE
jgi:hypothetical protein